MIVAILFLQESNPIVLQRRAAKNGEKKEESVTEKEENVTEKKEESVTEKEENVTEKKEESVTEKEEKPLKKEKIRITPTMLLCFCFEFCLRWTVNAFDSRYGIYLTAVFNTPSIVFS